MNSKFALIIGAATALSTLAVLLFAQQRVVPSAVVSSQLVLPGKISDGRTIDEISGLAWNETTQRLHAISDDNVLLELQLNGDIAAPNEINVVKQSKLSQTQMNSKNAEALDLTKAGDTAPQFGLVTSYEDVNRIADISIENPKPIERFALPENVASDPNDGVEAVASLPNGAVAYAYELPPRGNAAGVQSIFVRTQQGDTTKMDFPFERKHKWRIKAIDYLPDGSFLVLMRDRVKDSENFRTNLMLLRDCPMDGKENCKATTVNLDLKALDGPAFEGMAYTPGGQIFLVEDRKPSEGRTRLYVLQSRNIVRNATP